MTAGAGWLRFGRLRSEQPQFPNRVAATVISHQEAAATSEAAAFEGNYGCVVWVTSTASSWKMSLEAQRESTLSGWKDEPEVEAFSFERGKPRGEVALPLLHPSSCSC